MFQYDKFFKLLEERNISTYKLRKDNLISQASLTKMRNNKGNIDTRTLERLCSYFDCQPNDIMEYVRGHEDNECDDIGKLYQEEVVIQEEMTFEDYYKELTGESIEGD